MFHRSERLFLRPGFPDDWRAILAAVGDEAIVRNLARAPWPYGEADARGFASLPQDAMAPHFLVTRPTARGEELVGSAGMGRDDDGRFELGYWIARPHWGRGYATEAGRAVIEVARMLGHRRLVAGHFTDNPASGRVLRKLGFRPTGVTAQRHSAGRGGKADCVEFEFDLSEGEVEMPKAA